MVNPWKSLSFALSLVCIGLVLSHFKILQMEHSQRFPTQHSDSSSFVTENKILYLVGNKMEEMFKKRRNQVEKICQKYGKSELDEPEFEDDEPSRLFHFKKAGIFLCL